jgi:putative tricarboxylic transport membrane protein
VIDRKANVAKVKKRWFYVPKLREIKENLPIMLQGSIIGTVIGILPGMGGGAASLVSYEQAKKTSKTPEKFGTGYAPGIFSCESANNATTGGALVPMLALGVPGDTVTAIIMGAISLQGVTPGPLLGIQQPELFKTIIFIVFVANLFMFLYQVTTIRIMAKILDVPKYILYPIITVFCVIGVISIRNSLFDLFSLTIFIVIGYIFSKNDYPLSPFILAFVLGGIVEDNFRRAIVYYGGFTGCLKQPSIGTLFFAMAIILPIVMFIVDGRKSRQSAS